MVVGVDSKKPAVVLDYWTKHVIAKIINTSRVGFFFYGSTSRVVGSINANIAKIKGEVEEEEKLGRMMKILI